MWLINFSINFGRKGQRNGNQVTWKLFLSLMNRLKESRFFGQRNGLILKMKTQRKRMKDIGFFYLGNTMTTSFLLSIRESRSALSRLTVKHFLLDTAFLSPMSLPGANIRK